MVGLESIIQFSVPLISTQKTFAVKEFDLASRKYKPRLYISVEIEAKGFDQGTFTNCFRGIISAGGAEDLTVGTRIVLKKLIDKHSVNRKLFHGGERTHTRE